MSPLKTYFRFIDGCLADIVGNNFHSVERQCAWNDMMIFPTLIVGALIVSISLLVPVLGAPDGLRTIFGGVLLALFALHSLAVFWRWSIFDYEDYTGKKLDKHYEDFL